MSGIALVVPEDRNLWNFWLPMLLTEKIRALIGDKALRQEMGTKWQMRIRDNFTLNVMVKKQRSFISG